ncbi:uncharacterized protein LOC111037926 [Myzus persicae]|uniref:uncharacterized protein LOC111037926 n=1 Tax=Myzus persicae TaxID=13164 RepID=UPI000B930B48|nr:uncharacterized protein LOC111037926 [Myzus persicae]
METLPSEIITQILEYVSFDDRRELARVNKVFYHATSHPVFLRKEILIYQPSQVNLKYFKDFKNMLWNSRRKLLCLKFVNFTFTDDLSIFTNLGNHIISLNFINLILLNDSFLDAITQCCNNLEKLELKCLNNLCLTDKDREPILKLSTITLCDVQMSDRDFNLILKLAPNLKDLGIFDCRLTGGHAIIKRFYPHNSNIDCLFTKYNSDLIFSAENIVHHLNNCIRLNSLRLNEHCCIIYQIQPIQLELKSLTLSGMGTLRSHPIDYEKLNFVLGQYVSLEQLEISYLPVHLLSFVSKLHNLRYLKISYTALRSIYSDGLKSLEILLESLKNMKYLRTLSFNRVYEMHVIKLPTVPFTECTLKSLTSLDCSLDSNLVLKCGTNLTSLRIRNGDILKAEDLQLLFRNLTNLNHLWIDDCSILNDEIFIQLPISNLKELITLRIMHSNISHRCLQYITNSRLKVLVFTNVSLEPFTNKLILNDFKHSLEILSSAVPMLTQLDIRISFLSSRAVESLGLLSFYRTTFREVLEKYFKKLKLFILS